MSIDTEAIKLVDLPDSPLKFGWVEPRSIDENPLNWKIHTEFQSAVVSELIRKHGWIKPLIFNLTTARLLDGHDRRKIALARDLPYVPVIVGSWPEEQEPEIIASLDPSGALAKSDPSKLDEVMRAFADPAPVIEEMMTRLAESEGVLAYLKRAKSSDSGVESVRYDEDEDEDGEDRASSGPETLVLPTSHIRSVQLFIDVDAYPEFRKLIDDLAEDYGTNSDTDTIVMCLREIHRDHFSEDPDEPE